MPGFLLSSTRTGLIHCTAPLSAKASSLPGGEKRSVTSVPTSSGSRVCTKIPSAETLRMEA